MAHQNREIIICSQAQAVLLVILLCARKRGGKRKAHSVSKSSLTRDIIAKLSQIDKQKEIFREKFYDKHPLLVELTLWCLEHSYDRRPKFLDLRSMIIQHKHNNQEQMRLFRSGTMEKFPKVQTHGRAFNPKKKTFSAQNMSIQSNIIFQKDKSLVMLPQVQSEVFKKQSVPEKQIAIYSDNKEEEDFKLQSELIPSEDFSEEYLEKEKEGVQKNLNKEKSEDKRTDDFQVFDSNYSDAKASTIKRFRHRQKIFDESQDIYYREVKKEGLINYDLGENLGAKDHHKGHYERQTSKMRSHMPRRYIKASHE